MKTHIHLKLDEGTILLRIADIHAVKPVPGHLDQSIVHVHNTPDLPSTYRTHENFEKLVQRIYLCSKSGSN